MLVWEKNIHQRDLLCPGIISYSMMRISGPVRGRGTHDGCVEPSPPRRESPPVEQRGRHKILTRSVVQASRTGSNYRSSQSQDSLEILPCIRHWFVI